MVIQGADRFGLGAAPSAPRSRGARDRRLVLRPRLRLGRRGGCGPPRARWSSSRTASPSPNGTSSSGERGTCWASSRAACRSLRVASLQREDHRALATAAGPTPRRCSTNGATCDRATRTWRRSCATGWLAGGGLGRAHGWPPDGRGRPGHRRPRSGDPPPSAGRGDAAAGRPGQADPLRDPGAGPARGAGGWTCSPAAAPAGSRRSPGGQPPCWFVERDAGAVQRDRARTCERAGLAGPAAVVVRADAIEWLPESAAGACALRRRPRRPAVRPAGPAARRPARASAIPPSAAPCRRRGRGGQALLADRLRRSGSGC